MEFCPPHAIKGQLQLISSSRKGRKERRMAHIRCRRVYPNWQLYCESCNAILDVVSGEVMTYFLYKKESVLCMDCSGGADTIPPALDSDVYPYVLVIDGERCLVDPYGELGKSYRIAGQWFARVKEIYDSVKGAIKRDAAH